MFVFVVARSGADKHRLLDALLELIEEQGAVIICRRQAKTVVNKVLFSCRVTTAHAAHLRHGDVRLVDEHNVILGKIIEECERRGTGLSAREHTRVVFNARTKADLAQHFKVIANTLAQSLGFQKLVFGLEISNTLFHFALNFGKCRFPLLVGDGIVRGGINGSIRKHALQLSRNDIDLTNAIDLVTEKLNAQCAVVHICGDDFHRVAIDTEAITLEGNIVAAVAVGNQFADENIAADGHSRSNCKNKSLVFARVTERINAGNGCYDDDVATLKERACCAMAQAVNFIVDKGILLDIHILARNVRLGLVVVVVGNEIFHSGIGKEFTHLGADLRRQGFVGL